MRYAALYLALVCTMIPAAADDVKPLSAARLRCEYLEDPLGIDVAAPRLSWAVSAPEPSPRGRMQSAYRIIVASSRDLIGGNIGDVWDSKPVPSPFAAQRPYGGPPLKAGQQVWWKVKLWDEAGREGEFSEAATWSMGLLTPEDWGGAQWIGAPPQDPKEAAGPNPPIPPSPILRREFPIERPIVRAVAYTSALGLYELRLNGQRVGDHELAPEWTDYHDRVQYQAYDVTQLLRRGENAIGVQLADGWYAGRLGPTRWDKEYPRRGVYGIDRRFILKLDVTHPDGTTTTVTSDGEWRMQPDGPIQSADLFLGETHDARKRIAHWDLPIAGDAAWPRATVDPDVKANLVAQRNEPVRVVEMRPAAALSEPSPGVYIFDLGQNLVGRCRFEVEAKEGTEIVLRHGEMLNDDGTLYTENLAGALQTDRFIAAGTGVEVFEPLFTYHGFRYVEATGLPRRPQKTALRALVLSSDTDSAGFFKCSNPMLNQLAQNIRWTLRGNLIGVPTDCPQRDERMGWTGDMQVFCQTAMFNMDMAAFFSKWVPDLRDGQTADGRYPDIVPHGYPKDDPRFTNAPGWADVGVVVPWRMYQNYGDRRMLEEHYGSMKRFVDRIHETNPDLVWKNDVGNNYGDWLNGDTIKGEGYPEKGGELNKETYATAFFAHSAALLAQAATVLERTEDAARYAQLRDDIARIFNERWVDAAGRIEGGTQAGYALALHFDLLPEALRPKAAAHLVEAIAKYDNRTSTGFQSTYRMMLELTRWGYNDLAYTLAESTRFPSWGYSIEQGATTIWERWDAYVKGRGFQDPGMNSFNHYAIGAVGEWMYRVIAGINPDDASPGMQHAVLRPRPGGTLTHALAMHNSHAGPYASGWRIEGGQLLVDASVPPNARATIVLPVKDAAAVTEGGKPIAEVKDLQSQDPIDGFPAWLAGSGTYAFAMPWPAK